MNQPIEVIGREGVKARVICDSVNWNEDRLTTFEIEYCRLILGEVNTHRMLSKNSASSRAIPTDKMLDTILHDPAIPVYWGKNQPGMSAREELSGAELERAKAAWNRGMLASVETARALQAAGVHKQITGRVTEPWMRMKTVISGTEWANFFHLRCHPDAQPEFQELATVMRQAMEQSIPVGLKVGEWHLPYVQREYTSSGKMIYRNSQGEVSLDDAKLISASCCAQVSYRNNDDSLEKARNIYQRLIETDTPHSSPIEHQGTPMYMARESDPDLWEPGVTHMRRDGSLWSANYRGWIQARQLINNEAKWN